MSDYAIRQSGREGLMALDDMSQSPGASFMD